MLYIVTALYIEAKPLISLFNLKKDNSYTKFQVFSNENVKLIPMKILMFKDYFIKKKF